MSNQWVYIFGERRGVDIKIGKTSALTVTERLEAVNRDQTTEESYECLAAVVGASQDEAAMKRAFAHLKRSKGRKTEYFHPEPELVEYAAWLRSQYFASPDGLDERDGWEVVAPDVWLPDGPARRMPRPDDDPEKIVQDYESLEGPLSGTPWSWFPDPRASIQDYFTPLEIVDAVREGMGGIDLDAASHWLANRTLKIPRYFHRGLSAFDHDWDDRVWLNPPYGENDLWWPRVIDEVESGHVKQIAILSPVWAFTTQLAHPLMARSSAMLLLVPTPKFWGIEKVAPARIIPTQSFTSGTAKPRFWMHCDPLGFPSISTTSRPSFAPRRTRKVAETRIVFEAGPTHSGLEEALKLVNAARGADAIKFQLIDADRLVADRNKQIDFKVLQNGSMQDRRESLHTILKRRELSREEWKTLRNGTRAAGLDFYCTACYEDEFDFLIDTLEVDAVKVASSDIDNLPLLRYLSAQGVEVHIDTGSANIWEVDRAVETVGNPVIHHVPSGYPAHLPSIHLRVIQTLRMMYPELTIGFSDHSPGWEMDIAAVALGAELVEKTITLDRRKPEIEHCFSLEPDETAVFIQKIRDLEEALGSTRRTIPPDVLATRQGFRRSVHLTKQVHAGREIENLELRRPGDGIPPEFLDFVKGRKAKHHLFAGPLRWEDL